MLHYFFSYYNRYDISYLIFTTDARICLAACLPNYTVGFSQCQYFRILFGSRSKFYKTKVQTELAQTKLRTEKNPHRQIKWSDIDR